MAIFLAIIGADRSSGNVLLTLTSYEGGGLHPIHVHEDPGFFLLLRGQHRELRQSCDFYQSPATAVFHSESDDHGTELGPLGMTGLNISVRRGWLASLGEAVGDNPPQRLDLDPKSLV